MHTIPFQISAQALCWCSLMWPQSCLMLQVSSRSCIVEEAPPPGLFPASQELCLKSNWNHRSGLFPRILSMGFPRNVRFASRSKCFRFKWRTVPFHSNAFHTIEPLRAIVFHKIRIKTWYDEFICTCQKIVLIMRLYYYGRHADGCWVLSS